MDTKLFGRHQPGGLFQVVDREYFTGDIYWVDATNGTDAAGYGYNPDTPLASLHYAIANRATAGQGDVFFLLPGHAETLEDSDECEVDVAGVQVIGLGLGAYQPTFTLGTATDSTIAVSAANCLIKNIKVISDLADVAAGITAAATADGLVVEDCWFSDGAVDKELVIGISCAADCDNVTIRNCRFVTIDAGGCASGVKFVGATDYSSVMNCVFMGDYSAACIDGATAAGTYLRIEGNRAWNTDASAGLAIRLHASTTGWVFDNYCWGGKNGTAAIACDGAFCGGNYYSNAAGASAAILAPATDE